MITCICKIFNCRIRPDFEINDTTRESNADRTSQIELSECSTHMKHEDDLIFLFMTDLIDKLLRKKTVSDIFDIQNSVTKVLSELCSYANVRGVELKTNLNFKNPFVTGDPQKIEAMLWLFCRNIIKTHNCFELHAGSEVDLLNSKTRFLFVFNRSIILDNLSNRDRIFVRNVIKKHKISLRVTNSGKTHIEFSCDLHIEPKNVEMLTFLLVDDSELNLKFLKRKLVNQLKNVSYKIETIDDGKHALRMIRDKPSDYYSMIITDNDMPLMKGIDLCSTLKSEGYKVPIIGISADVNSGFIEKFVNVGGDYAFNKPILDSQVSFLIDFVKNYKKQEKKLLL